MKGKRAITEDTALRLARYFQWPAEVWLNLQAHYDRQVTEAEMRPVLARSQSSMRWGSVSVRSS